MPKRDRIKIGEVFSRLTVTKRLDDLRLKPHVIQIYECQCSCGNTHVVREWFLKNGHVRSCGCLNRDSLHSIPRNIVKRNSDEKAVINRMMSNYRGKRHFALTEDQFKTLVMSPCAYCGDAPYRRAYVPKRPTISLLVNGIDRVDSSGGYTVDNCVSCCAWCNWAKSNDSVEGFLAWVTRCHNHLTSTGW